MAYNSNNSNNNTNTNTNNNTNSNSNSNSNNNSNSITKVISQLILSMKNINPYLLMVGIYTISAILLWLITQLNNSTHAPKSVAAVGKYCFITAPSFMWGFLRNNRGRNYYLNNANGVDKDVTPNCMLTIWGLSHVILYMILGWFVPDMFWETFFIGIAFEYLEKNTFDCHDILDIMWNSIGFLIGKYFRRFL